MLVRAAVLADAAGLARVHVAAWRAAYVGIMPDAFLAELDESRFERGWVRALEEAAATTLVGLTPDGRVDGFASVGDPQDDDAPASGQLWALNLHPIAFGTGLGKALHDAALDALREQGHPEAYLWVAERNPRARRFYEREGWVGDGVTREEEFGGAPLTEARYRRRLDG